MALPVKAGGLLLDEMGRNHIPVSLLVPTIREVQDREGLGPPGTFSGAGGGGFQVRAPSQDPLRTENWLFVSLLPSEMTPIYFIEKPRAGRGRASLKNSD